MHSTSIKKYLPVAGALCLLIFTRCGGGGKAPEADAGTGFKQIFNGENLEGWDGDTTHWRVEGGMLIGEILPGRPLSRNTFLIWQGGQPADFEFKTQYRISEGGNSGINYRSDLVPGVPYDLSGYQADIDDELRYAGQNYDEHGRTTLAFRGQRVTVPSSGIALKDGVRNNIWMPREVTGSLGEAEALNAVIKLKDWNDYHVVVKGNRMQHFINGTLMSDVTDDDTVNRKMKGWLGVQVHVGPPMKVEFRNIQLKQ